MTYFSRISLRWQSDVSAYTGHTLGVPVSLEAFCSDSCTPASPLSVMLAPRALDTLSPSLRHGRSTSGSPFPVFRCAVVAASTLN